ncbi:MAG: acyltransferase [Vibrio litoralis]|uniref:acyltransferase n=1 Tax=Vibrio litoralis TaxID=335972 RepID=UPI003F967CAE
MIKISLSKLMCKIFNIESGNSVCFNGLPIIRNKGTFIMGDNVTFNASLFANPLSSNRFTVSVNKSGKLLIGNNTGLSSCTIYCRNEIVIGNNVRIGAGTSILDTDFHSIDLKTRLSRGDLGISKKISIDDGVFIGANCMILKGVTIGENSVVGAGSVVAKSIPKNSIWAGNPAVEIRKLPSQNDD